MKKTIILIVVAICIIALGITGYKYKQNKDYQKALVEQTMFMNYFKDKSSIDGLKISNKDFIDKSISSSPIAKNDLKQSHIKNNKYVVVYKLKHKDSKGMHNLEVDAYYFKKGNGEIYYKPNNIVFKQDKKVIDTNWAVSIASYNYYKGNVSKSTGNVKTMIQNIANLQNKYKNLDLTNLNKVDADDTIKKDELVIAQKKAREEEQRREQAEREQTEREKQQRENEKAKQGTLNSQNNNANANSNSDQMSDDEFRRRWIQDQIDWANEHSNDSADSTDSFNEENK